MTRASGSMPQSWLPRRARSKGKSSRKDCDISQLLSRKQINVTATANGFDSFLIAFVRSKLAPQVAHMHVNAAIHRRHGTAQRRLRQVFTGNDASRAAQEGVKQIE